MSSEWTGPTPIAQEYPKGKIESNGIQRLVNLIADLRRDLRESTSNLLSTAGIFLSRTGMRIASSLTVEGNLTSTGAADITGTTHIGGATDIDGTLNVDAATTIGGDTTVGGTLGVTGVTTLGAATSVTGALNVSGPMAITGTLSLPAGIIDNDALANPVTSASDKATTQGSGLTTTRTVKATASIAVPAGFTQATLWAAADVNAVNSTGSGSYLYVGAFIGAFDGGENLSNVPAGAANSVSISALTTVTGLSGGTIQATVTAQTVGAGWAADPVNTYRIQLLALFSR